MRTLLAGLVLLLVPTGMWAQTGIPSAPASSIATEPSAPPAHPATEDQIREYLSLLNIDRLAHEVLSSEVKAMQTTGAPYYPASFWADINEAFQKLDVTSVYVSVYRKYVSSEEMQTTIDFYRSPAGKKILALQPVLMGDAKVELRKRGGEIGAEVYARHKDEIERAKKSYEQQHWNAQGLQIPK